MKRKISLYSVVLTSIVCMFGWSMTANAAVRVLGNGGDTTSGDASTDSGSKSSVTTSAVTKNTRASSLRFAPTVSANYTGLATGGTGNTVTTGVAVGAPSSTARLSIGKYLNLSHNKSQSGSGSGGTIISNTEVDKLRTDLDAVQDRMDALETNKQSALVVDDAYIDIEGDDHNVISINMEKLTAELQEALGTTQGIRTEFDQDYRLWWCYANAEKTACAGDRHEIVDLDDVLTRYDLAHNNSSLSAALTELEGKQGILHEADNGYVAIDQELGTIDVKFDDLVQALGETDLNSEIRFQDGKLQWRKGDSTDWSTADIEALMQSSLTTYATKEQLADYVTKSQLDGLQGSLEPDENGYVTITNNKIGLNMIDLRNALQIPDPQAQVEIEMTPNGILRWRYVGETNWTEVDNVDSRIAGKLSDYVDNTALATALQDYVQNTYLTEELRNYAKSTYVDNALAQKQIKLTTADDGYIQLTPVEGADTIIGLKYDDLRNAFGIDGLRSSEIQVNNGKLQWRYGDDWLDEAHTQKKWTDVPNWSELLSGYVTTVDFGNFQDAVSQSLAGKQIKLTPATDGHIVLSETGVIGVDFGSLMSAIRGQLGETGDDISTELRFADGTIQWRYSDELQDGDKVWRSLSLPYVTQTELETNYYDKDDVDVIVDAINEALAKLSRPTDAGLYLLSVTPGDNGGESVSTWTSVKIVDGEGIVH